MVFDIFDAWFHIFELWLLHCLTTVSHFFLPFFGVNRSLRTVRNWGEPFVKSMAFGTCPSNLDEVTPLEMAEWPKCVFHHMPPWPQAGNNTYIVKAIPVHLAEKLRRLDDPTRWGTFWAACEVVYDRKYDQNKKTRSIMKREMDEQWKSTCSIFFWW